MLLLLALPAGALIGLSLGALGGGGSILTVPALVYLLGLSAHQATTGSLIIVGVTALAGMVAHLRAGHVQVRSGIIFGVLGAGGAYAGSVLSASVNPHVLLAAFSVLIAIAAVSMLHRQRRPKGAPNGPSEPSPADGGAPLPADGGAPLPVGIEGARGGVAVRELPARTATRTRAAPAVSPVRIFTAATIVGLVTGFFGVGGGFVVVPALVLALGFDMPTAVGTSLLVIAINSASSLLSRVGSEASINLTLLGLFTAAAIAGTIFGSRIASKVKPERLVSAFALLLIAVAIYTAARSFPHLV